MALNKSILLTIDVEDWFQVENLRAWFPPATWDLQPERVIQNTRRLLDLFDSFQPLQIKATFFVLGRVAQSAPSLVREIQHRGHEVASHGFGHLMCTQLSRDDLEKDLICSKALIEDIVGSPVYGYRAPSFSVNDHILKTIRQVGFQYDSSYNSFSRHNRYGKISANGQQKKGIAISFSDLFYEIPISNLKVGNQIIPWGGGGYFRLTPFFMFKAGVRQILKNNDAYMFYIHPWEIDPEQPRIKVRKSIKTWCHYLNLKKTYPRLKLLINTFKKLNFQTCSQYLTQQIR